MQGRGDCHRHRNAAESSEFSPEDADVVAAALELFRSRPALGFPAVSCCRCKRKPDICHLVPSIGISAGSRGREAKPALCGIEPTDCNSRASSARIRAWMIHTVQTSPCLAIPLSQVFAIRGLEFHVTRGTAYH